MSQDDNYDSGMAQQVKDLLQGAMKEHLFPIMDNSLLWSPGSRNQAVVSLVVSPLYWDDELLPSTH